MSNVLANIVRPLPGSDGWITYWFSNWTDHLMIRDAIQKTLNVNHVVYPINPWSNDNSDVILQLHQLFHNDMNDALGINGEDLAILDFNDQSAVEDWVYQHYQEHQQVHEVLGI